MSAEAIGWVFRKVQMDDATTKFVLVAICNYANGSDQAWPSHATVAKLTGLSKRSIQNSIKKLEDWGIIVRQRRDRLDGSETSAMVSIDLETEWLVNGGVATRATGVTQQVQGGVAPAATLEPTIKPSKKDSYSEEFEALWKQAAELGAPRTKNTSKQRAWDHYRMLNDENRERVRRAIPAFAAAMRAEARPPDKIPHFEFFMSRKIWETTEAPAGAPVGTGPSIPWHQQATREQWVKLLRIYRGDHNWRPAWGPAPGKPGCGVPDDLLTDGEKNAA